jgi:secondary thiamine-phosphate synthase enzyme
LSIFQKTFHTTTRGNCDVLDITARVERIISESRIRQGLVNVSGCGSTLGITTLEFEPGCVADLKRALEKIAPVSPDYAHHERWGDDNGYSHLRSALMGTSKSFPLSDGKLRLGTWQQIVLCDFDSRSREREVTVTVLGE